jgi:hypothetical protein
MEDERMGNETERNQQNPSQRQQNNPGNVTDTTKKDPYQSGADVHNPQDPTRKNPGQDSGTGERGDREGSEEVEKRRAS